MSQTAQTLFWSEAFSVTEDACEAFDQKRMYTHTAAMSDESAQA